MRKEPYGVGSFVHVIHRGTRGSPIVRDASDRDRFLLMLAHFNDEYQPMHWSREVSDPALAPFERPAEWPEQKKLVHIIAFCLLDNHFHLLLEEIQEGGISKFMQRIGTSMSYRFNLKYHERGSLFQGSFRARTVDSDEYLRYVIAYIQLKNTLDMYENRSRIQNHFEQAYTWACQYPYSSLGDHAAIFARPIIDTSFLLEIFSPTEFKLFGRDFIEGRADIAIVGDEAVSFE